MTYSEFRNQFSDVECFLLAYGKLTFEEAKALADAEMATLRTKAILITVWHEARRRVKLWNVRVDTNGKNGLTVVVYEDESEFDGNDFEYSYSLDAESAAAFLGMIPHPYADMKTNVEEWICENDLCRALGGDLQDKWIRMGLHGKHAVYEDYPGGIDREESF